MNTQTGNELIEGNKLIAVFIDKPVLHTWESFGKKYDSMIDVKNIKDWGKVYMQYHKSWDWLIPVVDDIYYSRRFNTGVQTSEINSKPYKLYKNIEAALLHLSIDQTWQAVVEFIKWKNENI